MADYRQIHTSIWSDEWFLELEPDQKLLFIYLFSNKNASLCGLYKLPIRVMEFETGLDQQYIIDTLSIFSAAGKVHYQDGIVWVVNMMRYHESKSPKVKANIAKDIERIPDCELKTAYLKTIDTVSIQYRYPSAINLKELKEEELKDTVSERRNGSSSHLETIQEIAERLTGIMVSPADVKTIKTWEEEGVIESDIRDALQWRADNKHPPIKTISQLMGGVKTSRIRRIQSQSAHKAGIDYDPAAHATEVYN